MLFSKYKFLLFLFPVAFFGIIQKGNATPIDSINVWLKQARIFDSTGQFITVDTILVNKCLNLSLKENYQKGQTTAVGLKGLYYYKSGDYLNCIAQFQQALEMARRNQDPLNMVRALNYLGTSNMRLERYEEAEKMHKEGIRLCRKHGIISLEITHLHNLGVLYQVMDKTEASLDIFLQLYALRDSIKNKDTAMKTESALGVIYLNLKQFEKAAPHLKTYYEYSKTLESRSSEVTASLNLGNYYADIGNFQKAYELYQDALEMGKKQDVQDGTFKIHRIYNAFALALEKEKKYDKALEYWKLYQEAKDNFVGLETQKQLNELIIKHETALSQNEITRLSQENQIQKQRLTITYLTVALLILGALAVIARLIFVNQKRKEIHRLKMETARKEIELKTRDVTNLALEINRKHDFSNNLLEKLERFNLKIPSDNQKEWRQFKNSIEHHLQLDEDKQLFQNNIDQINHTFFDKLKTRFPNLTKGDLDLCSFVRLGLSNKEIATLRNISADSVRVSRHRLKRKLGLIGAEDMTSFLLKF